MYPPKESIQKDGFLFLQSIKGCNKFHYSLFMACMRDMAVRYSQNLLLDGVFGQEGGDKVGWNTDKKRSSFYLLIFFAAVDFF